MAPRRERVVRSGALPAPLPASFWSDVDRIALCVHRPSGSSDRLRRVVDRLQIPAGSFVVSAARHIAAGRVTLEQLQLLGRYESRSVVAANAMRHVELGLFRESAPGVYEPSDDFRGASTVVLDVQAAAADALWAGSADVDGLATSADAVVAAVVASVPTPAFAAQRSDHDVTPSSAAGRLLAFVTELRYLRADLHAHALAEHGLSGPTARAVDRAWKGHDLTADERRRLEDKGLIVEGPTGWELVDGVRAARASVEDATERSSAAALGAAPAGARSSLVTGLAHLPGEDPRPIDGR